MAKILNDKRPMMNAEKVISTLKKFFFLTLCLLQYSAVQYVSGMAITYDIPQSSMECLYERLDADEHATMSVFITSGAELKGLAKFEGPVAPPSVTTSSELHTYAQKFARGERFAEVIGRIDPKRLIDGFDKRGNIVKSEMIDFEHPEYADMYDDYYGHMRMEGEPFHKTIQVIVPGWYRACVVGSWYQISAEIQFRKSSELGIDNKTSHVTTYEEFSILEDEKEIDQDAAKEEDLSAAKTQIRTLHRILANIRDKQENERRRLEVHKATNEHSHSRMVLNSLMETVLFMVVTGFQVYTIRKWFSGNPLLG